MAEPRHDAQEWIQPPPEQGSLLRYVETVRERLRLIIVVTAITTAIAVAYVVTATKMYDASADMLITPASSGDTTLSSLGVITESTDPTRDTETAARLVTNLDVAERAKKDLGASESAQDLLDKVTAEPVAGSNIVAITATDSSPEFARDLANAFADGTVADRTDQLHREVDERIPGLEAQLRQDPTGTAAETLGNQLAQLETLRSGTDPSMRLETPATVPPEPSSPRTKLSVIGGVLAGLVLGLGAAFSAQLLDPRLRREEQLRRLYRLPILARIPRETKTVEGRPLEPRSVSPVTSEAFRTLRATLAVSRADRSGGQAILVTGSSPAEGKSTTAINLASSLALAGSTVILIEADLRRPSLGSALGVRPENGGVVSVLIENQRIREALVQPSAYSPNLHVLLADYEGGWIADLFGIPAAEKMIDDAKALADYVILDSAPLNEVVDALPLARKADDVLIVVRIGTTRLDKLARLSELLAESSIRPVGFSVVGSSRPRRGEYHYYAGVAGESGEVRGKRQLAAAQADQET